MGRRDEHMRCKLTQDEPHGERFEVDRVVNPHVDLKRRDYDFKIYLMKRMVTQVTRVL